MNWIETLKAIRADYKRYRQPGWKVVFFTQGFWATFVYRLTRFIYLHVKIPVIRQLLKLMSMVVIKLIEVMTNITIPVGCDIGSGLYIGHLGHMILHHCTKIGRNCNLSQGVTIGVKRQKAPTLGDRVYVGPNAVIFGDITIGDDVAIGAGAIVLQSVPSRAVVVGNPGRIVSYKGSFDFIKYEGYKSDPERLASLHQSESFISK